MWGAATEAGMATSPPVVFVIAYRDLGCLHRRAAFEYVRAHVARGGTIKAYAADRGLPVGELCRAAKQAGIISKKGPHGPRKSPEQFAHENRGIIADLRNGMTQQKIGDKWLISRQAVSLIAIKAGLRRHRQQSGRKAKP